MVCFHLTDSEAIRRQFPNTSATGAQMVNVYTTSLPLYSEDFCHKSRLSHLTFLCVRLNQHNAGKHLDENEMPLSVVWVFCLPDIKQLDSCKHLDDALNSSFFIQITKS